MSDIGKRTISGLQDFSRRLQVAVGDIHATGLRVTAIEVCWHCSGAGKRGIDKCPICNGTGCIRTVDSGDGEKN